MQSSPIRTPLPSYRRSIDNSPLNPHDTSDSMTYRSDMPPSLPHPRYSFIKFNISEGLTRKDSLKATRESLEEIQARENSMLQSQSQSQRPMTANSLYPRNENSSPFLHKTSSTSPYFLNFSQKKSTLTNLDMYNTLKNEKSKIFQEGGDFFHRGKNINHASVDRQQIPSTSIQFSNSQASFFGQTSAGAKSPVLSSVRKSSPNIILGKSLSATSVPSSKAPTRPVTARSGAIHINTAKAQNKSNAKQKPLSAAQADTMKRSAGSIANLLKTTTQTQNTEGAEANTNPKVFSLKRKKTRTKNKNEEAEELTIDKISENHFHRFKGQVSLYNRFFSDYVAEPDKKFNSLKDLRVELYQNTHAGHRRRDQILLDITQTRRQSKLNIILGKLGGTVEKKQPVNFYNHSKNSSRLQSKIDVDTLIDLKENTDLTDLHSKHIRNVDNEKLQLNLEVYKITGINLSEIQERFMKCLKNNDVTNAGILLNADSTLTQIVDGVRETPLHWAAKRGFLPMVELLLKYNADFRAKDIVGRMPKELAQRNGHQEIVRIFNECEEDYELEIKRQEQQQRLLSN